MEILIEREAGDASRTKVDKHERPTHASLVSTVFPVDNLAVSGAIIKSTLN